MVAVIKSDEEKKKKRENINESKKKKKKTTWLIKLGSRIIFLIHTVTLESSKTLRAVLYCRGNNSDDNGLGFADSMEYAYTDIR